MLDNVLLQQFLEISTASIFLAPFISARMDNIPVPHPISHTINSEILSSKMYFIIN